MFIYSSLHNYSIYTDRLVYLTRSKKQIVYKFGACKGGGGSKREPGGLGLPPIKIPLLYVTARVLFFSFLMQYHEP